MIPFFCTPVDTFWRTILAHPLVVGKALRRKKGLVNTTSVFFLYLFALFVLWCFKKSVGTHHIISRDVGASNDGTSSWGAIERIVITVLLNNETGMMILAWWYREDYTLWDRVWYLLQHNKEPLFTLLEPSLTHYLLLRRLPFSRGHLDDRDHVLPGTAWWLPLTLLKMFSCTYCLASG